MSELSIHTRPIARSPSLALYILLRQHTRPVCPSLSQLLALEAPRDFHLWTQAQHTRQVRLSHRNRGIVEAAPLANPPELWL